MYDFVQPVFTELIWMLGGGLLSVLAIAALGVRIHRKKAVNPLSWGLPLGVFVLAIVLAGVAGLANADVWTGTLASTLSRFLGGFLGLPLLGFTVIAGALGAFRTGPVRWGPALWVVGVALAAAVLTGIEAAQGVSIAFGVLRASVFVGLALPVAAVVAMAGERSAAGSIAALGWAMVVGLLEGSSRALVHTMAIRAASRIQAVELRGEAIDQMLVLVAGEVPWAWAVVGCAALAPLGVVSWGARRAHRWADLVALSWLLVLPLAYAWGLPDSAQLVAAAEHGPEAGG